MKGDIKNALLSKEYRRYLSLFHIKCSKCGNKHCCTTVYVPTKVFRIGRLSYFTKMLDYKNAKFGMRCLKCDNTWWHYYNLKERMRLIQK